MRRIGLALPFILLGVFAIAFHPSMRIYLLEFLHPWLFMIFSPQMYFLLATFFVVSLRKIPPTKIGITLKPLTKNIYLGLGWGFAGYLLLAVANMAMGSTNGTQQSVTIFEWTPWLVFSYFIFAPVSEELFFRGVVFHSLKENYSVNVSIIASSMLFAASHSSAMVGPMILGLIAAKLTEKTKSIFPGMIMHSLSNGLPWFFLNHCPNLQTFQKYLFFKL